MRITNRLKFMAALAALLGSVFLLTSAISYNEDPTVSETGWGQLCARAMLGVFEGKVDIALISGGELPSLGEMPKVDQQPNWEKLKDIEFVLVKISGADLMTALGRSAKYMPRKNANLLHLTGLSVFCKRNGETNIVTAASVGAKPIVPSETYRVAMTKFLATGGGPFVGLKSLEVVTKDPHSLQRQIRLKMFPRGKIAPPVSSYIFP
jgi:2',3'-cyclic-nucleotide 2'-phosphodiesterase (5'-nucleotidase family)